MRTRHPDEPCPTSVTVGRGLAELVGGLAALGVSVLGGGVAAARAAVEGAAWGRPPARDCGCPVHRYCCRCVPPCGGCCS